MRVNTPTSVLVIPGRVRIVPVAVPVAYSPVGSVNDDLCLLVDRNLPGSFNRFGLRVVAACEALVALAAHAPTTVGRNHVLVFANFFASFRRGLLIDRYFSACL
jgi:hypothetical protein